MQAVGLISGSVGAPENLGDRVNTPGNELFPTFRPNGDLYFSSDGHPGMGGLDIFIAKGNYYVPCRHFDISEINDIPQLIGDDIWSLMWFFNRKQLRVKIDVPEECPEAIRSLEAKINDYLQKPWEKLLSDHYEYKRPDIYQKA